MDHRQPGFLDGAGNALHPSPLRSLLSSIPSAGARSDIGAMGPKEDTAAPVRQADASIRQTMVPPKPAVVTTAAIVRGAAPDRYSLTPQSAGLPAISMGLRDLGPDDHEVLKHGFVVDDALYGWASRRQVLAHGWTPAMKPGAARGGAGSMVQAHEDDSRARDQADVGALRRPRPGPCGRHLPPAHHAA